MDAVRLSRLTTGLVLAAGGMAAGHLLLPYTPPAAAGRRALFWAIVVALGAWRGWSEGGLLEEPAPRRRRRMALYALGAAVLAYASNWLVHGGPHWP
jgi:hypothetical protein